MTRSMRYHRTSDSSTRTYRDGPPENSLTVNATHQMLKQADPPFSRSSAISPTRRWEKMCGYDVKNDLLGAVFQYKRPKVLRSGNDDLVRFDLNMHQWLVLLLLFDSGQAFFTLPAVLEYEELPDTLCNTVFVDVHGIRWNTSMIYVPPEPCSASVSQGHEDTDHPPSITGKINNGPKYPIDSEYVYCWDDLNSELRDYEVGILLRKKGSQTVDLQSFESRIEAIENLAGTEIGVIDRIYRDRQRYPESPDDILQELDGVDKLMEYVDQEDPIGRVLRILKNHHKVYSDYYNPAYCREEIASVLSALQDLQREELAEAEEPTTHLVGDAEIGMFT